MYLGSVGRDSQLEWINSRQVRFEGCVLDVDPTADVGPGDTYLGERNCGPKLATCQSVAANAVFATDVNVYPYDCHECLKVVAIDGVPVG